MCLHISFRFENEMTNKLIEYFSKAAFFPLSLYITKYRWVSLYGELICLFNMTVFRLTSISIERKLILDHRVPQRTASTYTSSSLNVGIYLRPKLSTISLLSSPRTRWRQPCVRFIVLTAMEWLTPISYNIQDREELTKS